MSDSTTESVGKPLPGAAAALHIAKPGLVVWLRHVG